MAPSVTPQDLTITPRDRRFGRGTRQQRWWMSGDPVGTAFYNALSATFPKGEAYFVESVRRYRDGAPPKLEGEIRAFVSQEVMHSREHVQFNKRALEAGYDLKSLEDRVEWRLSITRDRPPVVNLAATMALEHFTAILATINCQASRAIWPVRTESSPCGAGMRLRKSSIRASLMTPGCTRRGTGHAARMAGQGKVMLFVTRNFVVDRTLGTTNCCARQYTGPKAWMRCSISPGQPWECCADPRRRGSSSCRL